MNELKKKELKDSCEAVFDTISSLKLGSSIYTAEFVNGFQNLQKKGTLVDTVTESLREKHDSIRNITDYNQIVEKFLRYIGPCAIPFFATIFYSINMNELITAFVVDVNFAEAIGAQAAAKTLIHLYKTGNLKSFITDVYNVYINPIPDNIVEGPSLPKNGWEIALRYKYSVGVGGLFLVSGLWFRPQIGNFLSDIRPYLPSIKIIAPEIFRPNYTHFQSLALKTAELISLSSDIIVDTLYEAGTLKARFISSFTSGFMKGVFSNTYSTIKDITKEIKPDEVKEVITKINPK